MVAIYARQSVEKVDSISIDTQVEECKRKLPSGSKYEVYRDEGISGKNTDRPEFQRMMKDIRKGKIDKVISYKFDRVSRSLLDFVNIVDEFDRLGISFVSCKEDFDASSPMGKTSMNLLAVFAQFERETTQQRVTDAYKARSQKGYFMGGPIPFGFDREKIYIDGIKTSKFIEKREESEIVKLLFNSYVDPKISLGDLMKLVTDLGVRRRGKDWTRSRLSDLLKSPVYVKADADVYSFFKEQGAVIVNEPSEFDGTHGCYFFSGEDAIGRKHSNIRGNVLVLAPHEGFIEPEIWLKCRRKLLKNKQIKSQPKAKNTWLSGKIKCGKCGYALVDKSYKNKNVRYLFCSHRMNSKGCEGPGILHTDEVERAVYLAIEKRLKEFKMLSVQQQKKCIPEINMLNVKKLELEKKIDSLVKRIAEADDVLFQYINDEVKRLTLEKDEINQKIDELSLSSDIDTNSIENHLQNWPRLSFDDKKRVVDIFIKTIRATSEKVEIEWRF